MVEIAGGINGISKIGQRSHKIELSQISQFEPDILIMMPCGFDIDKILGEYGFYKNHEWNSLKAVQDDMVFAVDALSYFSRPSQELSQVLKYFPKLLIQIPLNLNVPLNSYTRLKN
jgi:iron complex transport system substrate-binding protein